jgi:isopentenyl-diphosphate delta-isomerase
MTDDDVVLLDEAGAPIGTAPKSAVHGVDTPLHLAFSCHVINDAGDVLVTRRALHKQTWPGVWTNSFCGHPRPAERVLDAVRRRADFELGLALDSIELALPLFRYRASDASGVIENEVCPVYLARTSDEPEFNHDEVAEYRWVDPIELGAATRLTPWAFSPWLVLQAQHLSLFGPGMEARASAAVDSHREPVRSVA